jgi:predicted RNA-binding protein YlqC (UPF0109 family)
LAETADTEELLRFLVTSLVEAPDAVKISRRQEGTLTVFDIELEPEDVGKVIGRKGRIIKAIRTVVRAAGGAGGEHVDVEVLG